MRKPQPRALTAGAPAIRGGFCFDSRLGLESTARHAWLPEFSHSGSGAVTGVLTAAPRHLLNPCLARGYAEGHADTESRSPPASGASGGQGGAPGSTVAVAGDLLSIVCSARNQVA